MGIETTSVYLTDQELALLDGHCSEKVQAKVDRAKIRLSTANLLGDVPGNLVPFITHIIEEAKTSGKLVFWQKRLRHCGVCGKGAGYAKYKRNSGYHNKGEPNYDKPLTFGGVELADRFIFFKGSASLGCCISCWKETKPFLGDALRGVKAAISEKITGYPPAWKWYRNRRCTKCGWEGHEGQMGSRRTIIGDGYCPAGCPECNACNPAFGPTIIETADGFTLVKASP